jgi:excisionase family DNA binding protein
MSDQLLSAKELAARLSVGLWAAYQLLKDDVLPPVYLGGRTVRVRASDVDAYIKQGGSKSRQRRVEVPHQEPARRRRQKTLTK